MTVTPSRPSDTSRAPARTTPDADLLRSISRPSVDAVQDVGISEVRGLAELGDAEAPDAVPACPGEEGERVRVAVLDGDQRRGRVGREQLVDYVAVAGGAVAALLARPEDQVGAGQADDARSYAGVGEDPGSVDDLGHQGADAHQRDVVAGGGVGAEPVAAGDDLLATALEECRLLGQVGEGRVERARGEPEVRRRTALDADPCRRVQEGPLKVGSEGRFPRDAAWLLPRP